jgi:MoxR-like ATPase
MAQQKTSDIPVVSPMVAKQCVREMLNAGSAAVPPFLWGPPGVGKSAIVKGVAEEEGVGFIDLRLVQLDQVDLRGLPYLLDDKVNEGLREMHFAAPGGLPREGRGILFLDEFPQATSLVQNAASELVLDRRCGEYRLPDGWIVVAAGNRRQDRAATQELPSHLKNRFTHLEIDAKFADWEAWAQLPNATKCGPIEPRLLAFLQSNQSRLNNFNPDTVASPTSRSWEFVSRILHTVKDKRARNALIGGAVGKGMQAEVMAFLSDSEDMPTMAQIIADPMTAPIPETLSGCNAALDNLALTGRPENAEPIAQYISRHVADSQMVALVQIMARKDITSWMSSPTLDKLMKANGLS